MMNENNELKDKDLTSVTGGSAKVYYQLDTEINTLLYAFKIGGITKFELAQQLGEVMGEAARRYNNGSLEIEYYNKLRERYGSIRNSFS